MKEPLSFSLGWLLHRTECSHLSYSYLILVYPQLVQLLMSLIGYANKIMTCYRYVHAATLYIVVVVLVLKNPPPPPKKICPWLCHTART